ncbi:hypothetical protein I4U23_027994 [Adineta vaga]|nr:hypothetical protein I4U23_027994 [Adineta vaga]
MSELGQCSDPSCTKKDVRLFDCVHHCMKLVCLQHLIEHDRSIDYNQEYFDGLRFELKQLWTTYSTFVDETKLRLEFEQKIKRHQQIIEDVTNLYETDCVNIEQYRLINEKLRLNIEQEKLSNQDCLELVSNFEDIKNEPIDEVEMIEKLDFDMTIQTEKSIDKYRSERQKLTTDNSIPINHYNHTTQNNSNKTRSITSLETTNNPSRLVVKFPGFCPFTIDGVFGLTKNSHGIYLCPEGKYYQNVSGHLFKYHRFTLSTIERIRCAIGRKEDPSKTILFQPNDSVINRITCQPCPFSIHHQSILKTTYPSIRKCRSKKPQLNYVLRVHLATTHRMKSTDIEKLLCKLEKKCSTSF